MDTANIIESISIIIAAWAVFLGVTAWRREYIGKKNLELAEEVLALFYEARDAISDIRNPFGRTGEGSTRKTGPRETPEEKGIYDRAFVTYERFNKYHELFSKLYSMRYRYMAHFGKKSAKPFDALYEITKDILLSADFLSEMWIDQSQRNWTDDPNYKSNLEEIRKYESIIWFRGKKDTIVPQIDKIIEDIEGQSRIILQPSLKDRIKQWLI